MFKEQPYKLSQSAAAMFNELKPEYQAYILKQIDQLLEIQHAEEKKQVNGITD